MVPGEGQLENEKSFVDWIKYSVVLAFSLPCLLVLAAFFKYEGAWSMWLSLFLSRGIYVVLATLIFGCFIITFFKSKVQTVVGPVESRTEDSWCSPNNLWKPPFLASCSELTLKKSFNIEEACSSDAAKQLLREADARNDALKRELEELNTARLALEERSGQLEREKAMVEERLEEAKFKSALESEGLRKEAAVAQRQLQQIIEEKELLSREVSSVSREARITDSALKDQARLTTRLEEARAELNRLKLQMEDMKMERDTAIAIAADLAVRAQGAADDSAQLIGQWVKREMENRKSKLDIPSTIAMVAAEPETNQTEEIPETNEDQEENKQNEKAEMVQNAEGVPLQDDKSASPIENKIEEATETKLHLDINLEGVTMMNWEDDSADDCLQTIGCGPVTSSAAFRDFLTAHYSQLSL